MLWKNLLLLAFKDGFRIMPDDAEDDKFFVLDECKFEIGDEYRVGPNGYFEKIGNHIKDLEL
jgi:hypothetical protein|tara:strand:- start:101 stop:286 length:186 start_codon:yes stop_codon:yes gene_type:complete